jgi:pyridoxine kinase
VGRIIALSSFVASGTVGLRVIIPALEALGHRVVAIPSVVLSSHAGYTRRWGLDVPASDLDGIVAALTDNGWLGEVDAVLTGYLPSAAHVHAAGRLVDLVRRRSADVCVVCDPVLGDWPKGLYIATDAARAMRDELLPRADVATPNVFELSWLTGLPTADIEEAAAAAQRLKPGTVYISSVPARDPNEIATVLATQDRIESSAWEKFNSVPHGAGDLLAGLLTGYLAAGINPARALEQAGRQVYEVVAASRGHSELARVGPLQASHPVARSA